jgi:S1-C subfamily serine protease
LKLRLLVLALAAGLALHPAQVQAQADTSSTRAGEPRAGFRRNPDGARNGPSTGISMGFSRSRGVAGYPHVLALAPGGSGERSGLMVGDTIRSVNGRDARQAPVFPNRVPGARYVLRVRRDGEEREVILVLPATPAAPPRQR